MNPIITKIKKVGLYKNLVPILAILTIFWYTASHTYAATKSPDLVILTPKDRASVSEQTTTITGKTSPGSLVKINNVSIPVSPEGIFSATTALVPGRIATFIIKAQGRRGKIATQKISIVSDYPRSEELILTKQIINFETK